MAGHSLLDVAISGIDRYNELKGMSPIIPWDVEPGVPDSNYFEHVEDDAIDSAIMESKLTTLGQMDQVSTKALEPQVYWLGRRNFHPRMNITMMMVSPMSAYKKFLTYYDRRRR